MEITKKVENDELRIYMNYLEREIEFAIKLIPALLSSGIRSIEIIKQ